jgi:putative photosynthetic complex assembly protein 2
VATYGVPILATLVAWWFSTGAILYLDGLARRTFKWSFAAATLLALAALWGVIATADDTSATGAYLATACALMLWGWNEMAFLFGFITGSRREPCQPGARGLARFLQATRAVLHHELALLATLLLIALLSHAADNRFALASFALLFAMRLSTKLNIFLGVPNTTIEFLPPHLGYLTSYFRQKPMNLLFPLSITAATLLTSIIVERALVGDPFLATGFTLLATLAALGLIEHWFLVLPLPVAGLWSWSLASHREAQAAPLPALPETATPRTIPRSSLVA